MRQNSCRFTGSIDLSFRLEATLGVSGTCKSSTVSSHFGCLRFGKDSDLEDYSLPDSCHLQVAGHLGLNTRL